MIAPEQRLMLAIVERTLLDARAIVARTYSNKTRIQDFGDIIYNYNPSRDLEQLKYHIKDEWFQSVCEFAGLHYTQVLRQIKHMEERAAEKYARAKHAS